MNPSDFTVLAVKTESDNPRDQEQTSPVWDYRSSKGSSTFLPTHHSTSNPQCHRSLTTCDKPGRAHRPTAIHTLIPPSADLPAHHTTYTIATGNTTYLAKL